MQRDLIHISHLILFAKLTIFAYIFFCFAHYSYLNIFICISCIIFIISINFATNIYFYYFVRYCKICSYCSGTGNHNYPQVKALGCQEICRFGQGCKRFNILANDEKLWQQKAKERWGIWGKSFQDCENWKAVYEKRHGVELFVAKDLVLLQKECGLKTSICAKSFNFLETCLKTFGNDSHLYLNDVIQTILKGSESSKNLTQKYFAAKANISFTHIMCKSDLHSYLENPESAKKLEKGAAIIARWMSLSSSVSQESIEKKLDEIANMVKATLKPEDQDITSKSDKSVQLRVLNALQNVFYKQLKFSGNRDNYYNLSNSYINEVLETKLGIPITLSIIFQSIATRLGFCIEPVNCPGHFLVRWKYFDSSVNEIKYRHIDCFNNGVFLERTHLPHSLSPGPVPAPREILKRMMLNIINILQNTTDVHESVVNLSYALDLFRILAPEHLEMTRLNARIKLYLRIQLDEVIESMEAVIANQSNTHFEDKRLLEVAKQQNQQLKKEQKVFKVKLRSNPKNSGVALKIGAIMRHKRFDYRCVVYGWNRSCKMPGEWIFRMGVNSLPNGQNQPFYNVLVNDGTERYAAEENLVPETKIQMITHASVGLYFKEFTGDRYVPNDELQQLYPEDLRS